MLQAIAPLAMLAPWGKGSRRAAPPKREHDCRLGYHESIRVYFSLMSSISGDELRKRVEWARNNGKAAQDASGGIRFEHQGKTYLIPSELLVSQGGSSDGQVELADYVVRE